ncbi:MAG TPA: hypothetical protein VGF03_01715, partial [Bryobacteraceae bacterium]
AVYAQTLAFAWDEGFHLLAAQLIKNGKTPYLDFFFPQAPLNAYWNAGWMRLFGDTWRTAHAVAGLVGAAGVLLAAHAVYARFPIARWRLAGALAVVALAGLNHQFVDYSTIAQGYALCLFLLVAAYRCALWSVERRGWLPAAAAGFCVVGAAGATLLGSAAVPILLVWLLIYNRAGARWTKLAGFLAGAALPLLPFLPLAWRAWRIVRFNIVEYHLLYRQVAWDGATAHDADVLTAWANDPQAILLAILVAVGVFFVRFRSDWDRATRAPFYLCGWLALGLSLHISTAHPTFARYYLLTLPFLATLAVAGLSYIVSQFAHPMQPRWPVVFVSVIVAIVLARDLFDDWDGAPWWGRLSAITRKLDEVVPRGAPVFADESIYFLSRRTPPSGLEHDDSHKLQLKPELEKSLHIFPKAELIKQIAAGRFAAVASCEDTDEMDELGVSAAFEKKFEDKGKDCAVYWKWKQPPPPKKK